MSYTIKREDDEHIEILEDGFTAAAFEGESAEAEAREWIADRGADAAHRADSLRIQAEEAQELADELLALEIPQPRPRRDDEDEETGLAPGDRVRVKRTHLRKVRTVLSSHLWLDGDLKEVRSHAAVVRWDNGVDVTVSKYILERVSPAAEGSRWPRGGRASRCSSEGSAASS